MKILPPHILVFLLLLSSCELENSDAYNKTGSNQPSERKVLPGKHQPDESSKKITTVAQYVQQAVVVDSTLWMNGMDTILMPEEEILYLNTRWEVITKASFLDSVLMSNYGSIVLINTKLEKVEKLKKIINFENDSISQALIKYDGFSLINIPDSLFMDLNGTFINNTILDQKIVVLNFWFIGCKACLLEIPFLNNLVDKYKNNKEVIFLAPSTDTPAELINFSLTKRFKYRLTSVNNKLTAKRTFRLSSFPTNMIIGKDGKVKYVSTGGSAVAVKWLDLAIEKALNMESNENL